MEKLPCSIFNDVIGPVMRGPSSSHVAGAARIASLIRQSMNGKVKKAVVDFDVNGALAASHTGHGTDMGVACGLMDMDLADPSVDQYERLAEEQGIEIIYQILDYGAVHPGNYRVETEDVTGTCRHWEGISVGGGMIEMQRLENFSVTICGDFYELLVICDRQESEEQTEWLEKLKNDSAYTLTSKAGGQCLYEFKFAAPVKAEIQESVRSADGIADVIYLEPVLPTHSRADCSVPYSNAAQLAQYAKKHPMEPWEYGALYESCRGGVSRTEVWEQMDHILSVMEQAVHQGLAGTTYEDRILGEQSYRIAQAEKEGKIISCTPLNQMIQCITAVMETKSAMGLIVAAPTCGSCGCLPGTVIGMGRALNLSREEMIKGLFVAGLIGVFFAEAATFSAEVGGCQVECGAGSGMAAGAIAQMLGGNITQCVNSASVALQNITGLACDPVGNRVEVPCLGKNVMGGSNALVSAEMILAGYEVVIPLDETIEAIYDIGRSLPLELRCTCGGLGKTKTSEAILKKLSERK